MLHSTVLDGKQHSQSNIVKTSMYRKCSKISYTKVPDKTEYANSADPDQEWSDQALHCCNSSK